MLYQEVGIIDKFGNLKNYSYICKTKIKYAKPKIQLNP